MGPAPGGAPRLGLSWPRSPGQSPGPGTGDLRFDGRVAAAGSGARLSAWLAADLRARLGAFSDGTRGAVRVRGGRLFVHVAATAPPSLTVGSVDVDALWSACARALTDPLGRLVRRACADPDPRARAVAARRLVALARGRPRSPYDEALVALLAAGATPDWIRIEAFLCLWRAEPFGRRRWVEIALDAERSALGPVVVRAVLESDLPLAPLVARDPALVARQVDAAWQRGTERERARLCARVEDLGQAEWQRLRSAAAPDAAATFMALGEARRGALSAPDLAGGELALQPERQPEPEPEPEP